MRVVSLSLLTAFQMILGVSTAFGGGTVYLNPDGTDPRQDMNGSAMPWSSIGQVRAPEFFVDPNTHILMKQGYTCTGTLIGKRLVLTAAHCVIKENTPDTSPPALKSITFVPNYQGGVVTVSASTLQETNPDDQSTSPAIKVGTMTPNANWTEDWAIVVLDKDLGTQYGFMDIKDTTKSSLPLDVQFAGYSGDYKNFPMASMVDSCQLKERMRPAFGSGKVLAHNCSAMQGASGGALFNLEGDRYTVAAVHTRGNPNSTKMDDAVHGNFGVMTDSLIDAYKAAKLKYDQ